jgi:hypothetical protein
MKRFVKAISEQVDILNNRRSRLINGDIIGENDWGVISAKNTNLFIKNNDVVLIGCQSGFISTSFFFSLVHVLAVEKKLKLLLYSRSYSMEMAINLLFLSGQKLIWID